MNAIDDLAETHRLAIDSLKQRMADFEAHLKASSPGEDLSGLRRDYSVFKEHVWSVLTILQQQMLEVRRSSDVIEMRHRQKFLLLGGVPEKSEEIVVEVVASILTRQLELPDVTPASIKVCHRLGAAAEGRPRPIFFRFTDLALKKKVWRAKTKLKGTSYVLSEFLTRQRQSAFTVARKLFGVRSVWTMDGNINIKLPDGRRRRVFVYEEVVELGTEHGRSLEVPQPSLSTKAGSKIITVSSPAQVSSRSRRNGPKK
ncbi:hypothetical protein HW555_010208 [Spodoptera exigua]|uniref:Uncharacterized protein n=1 Tax=Spodoptera exigua TaxID=7107 RepID=A0A835GAC2_SPOEX|nr:hypothetical protein HW555_010208 [Spodoptera exigua]